MWMALHRQVIHLDAAKILRSAATASEHL